MWGGHGQGPHRHQILGWGFCEQRRRVAATRQNAGGRGVARETCSA
jgi:hypothetical protein